jgi:hypothetical protein
MDFASGRLALKMTVCQRFAMERPQRPWEEQVIWRTFDGQLQLVEYVPTF